MAEDESRIFKLLNDALRDSSLFLPGNPYGNELIDKCWELWNRDNYCTKLRHDSPLCTSYPIEMIIPLRQKTSQSDDDIDEASVANDELLNLVLKGRLARTRGRFPIPVILIGNKFVCRSSTLAHPAEIYARHGINYFLQGETAQSAQTSKSATTCQLETPDETSVSFKKESEDSKLFLNLKKSSKQSCKLTQTSSHQQGEDESSEWMLNKARKHDIDLMHLLKVNVICDLMVENKKAKFGMYVTSSEKVDNPDRYSDFELVSIPYPGCEFFADYTRNHYTSAGLKFDWGQAFIDAELKVPGNLSNVLNIDWSSYTEWELVEITQNYLKLILNCLISPNYSGILLHCISGWDRTPLFVSLVRLSLWADGLIHTSLDAEEIVYFTLVYDWLLFCHLFSDRINKEEEIMHFCFDFLKHISSDEYSLLPKISSMEDPFFYSKSVGCSATENGGTYSNSSVISKDQTKNKNESSDFEYILEESNLKLNSMSINNGNDTTPKFLEPRNGSCNNNENCLHKVLDKTDQSPTPLNGALPVIQINSQNGNKNGVDSATQPSDVPENPTSSSFSSSKKVNTLASSDGSDVNGHSSNQRRKLTESSVMRIQIEQRKQKLTMAENTMIPIYCAVVQKRKQELNALGSGLSTMMMGGLESLMKYVTRT